MVLVKNPSKRPITVVLTHPDAPKTDVAFQQPLTDPQTGELSGARQVDLRLPESVTLFGGEERELPDYARALARAAGLEVVKRDDASKDKPAAQTRGDKDAGSLPNALKRKKGASE
jgi:hypothetical protein